MNSKWGNLERLASTKNVYIHDMCPPQRRHRIYFKSVAKPLGLDGRNVRAYKGKRLEQVTHKDLTTGQHRERREKETSRLLDI